MWSRSLLSICQVLSTVLLPKLAGCGPVTTDFNGSLRDYSVTENVNNSSNAKTLQKEIGRYASFAPVRNPIAFKEVPDNAISSSSYSRGLLHHEHGGYGLHDYDDSPHHGYGFDYHGDHHGHDDHHGGLEHGYHGYDHGHSYGHGHGYGHGHDHGHGHGHGHHKHYDHGLATKTLLWPIAGIALLGAAAALVSNPVLLQLGVISGRKRRDTEEASEPDFDIDFSKWAKKIEVKSVDRKDRKVPMDKGKKPVKMLLKDAKRKESFTTPQSPFKRVLVDGRVGNNGDFNGDFIPVPLKLKNA